MPKIVDGEEYLNTKEAIKEFGVSKQTFYANAKQYLRVHHFSGKLSPWYSKREVQSLANGKPIRKASIAITGMFSNWTEHARSLGFDIQSMERERIVERLPVEVAESFHVTTDTYFVRVSEMSWIEGQPVCCWSTWYPIELVSDVLPQIMDGSLHKIIDYIADRHGIVIREVSDVYAARISTFEEMALFQLLNNEPLLILQRMARTEDQQIVVLYQDMQLLSNWFVVRRTENIHYWDKK